MQQTSFMFAMQKLNINGQLWLPMSAVTSNFSSSHYKIFIIFHKFVLQIQGMVSPIPLCPELNKFAWRQHIISIAYIKIFG